MGWSQIGQINTGASSSGGGPGRPGRDGNNGATWYMGPNPPTPNIGNVGDFFFLAPPPNQGQPILIPGPKGDRGPPGVGLLGLTGPAGAPGLFTAFTAPTLSAFTLTNAQTGATLTQAGSSIVLYGPNNNSDNFSMALKNIPSTPYSCIFCLASAILPTNTLAHTSVGVLWYDSVGVKVKTLGITYASGLTGCILECGKGTDGTAHITGDYVTGLGGMQTFQWFKLRDDGVNQSFSVSADGQTWLPVFSHASNTDVTPNKVGFYTNPRNAQGFDTYAALWSYQETS